MPDHLFQIIFFLSGILFLLMLHYCMTRIFRRTVKVAWLLLAYSAFLVVSHQLFFGFDSAWLNITVNLLGFVLLTLLYNGSFSARVVFAISLYAIAALGDMLAFFSLSAVNTVQGGDAASLELLMPFGQTLSIVIFLPSALVYLLLVKKFLTRKVEGMTYKVPTMYTVVVFLMLVGIILINAIIVSMALYDMQMRSFPIAFVHIISSIVIFLIIWLYNTLLEHLETFEKNKIKDQMLEHWQTLYQTAASTQSEITKLKHNLSLSFLTLASFLKKGEVEGAAQYIADTIGTFDHIIATGNMAVDTMLNYYRQKASEEVGVTLKLELLLPPNLNLDTDMTVLILGNALENAIDACRHLAPSQRYIAIKMVLTPQNELLTMIENPYAIMPVVDKVGNFITSKKNKRNHGQGLRSVLEMLPEEKGQIHIDYKGNIFCFTLLFYNISGEKNSS